MSRAKIASLAIALELGCRLFGGTLNVPDTIGTSTNAAAVGIGTASPEAKLQVIGSLFINPTNDVTGGLYYGGANLGLIVGRYATSPWPGTNGLFVGGTSMLMGNVGIGRTNPAVALDVNGSIIASGANAFISTSAGGNWGFVHGNYYAGQGGNVYNLGFSNGAIGIFNGSTTAQDVYLFNRNDPSGGFLVLKANGNVGIGTTNPQSKLQIGNQTSLKDGTWASPANPGTTSAGERIVFYQDAGWKTAIGMDPANGIWFQAHTPSGYPAFQWFTGSASSAPTERVRIMDNGNVGIGTTNPTQKLSVNGTVRAREVIVESTGWSDYVFEESYPLSALSEVERHIKSEKHLPGIPSASEVAEHGVSVGEMQAKLLAKVEELTLYVIDLKKENTALRGRVEQLETRSSTAR